MISSSLSDVDGSETLLLELGNLPVGTYLTDGSNAFTATSGDTTVDVSDWNLSSLQLTAPPHSDQDFTVTVTATATEAENGDQAVRTDTMDVLVTAVADQPMLTVPSTITVNEDSQSAAFAIGSSLYDSDGSETLTVEVADVPIGATLTDGTNSFTATSGNTSIDVSNWVLTNLAISPAADSDIDFTLTVTATATEAANHDQSARVDSILVAVAAVADQPHLSVPSTITVAEDTQSAAFAVSSSLSDTDGSETLRLEVSGIPVGAMITDGLASFTATSGNSTVDITSWALSSLTITPPADSDADFVLTVTATATEAANGDQAVKSDAMTVEVAAVADRPTLTVPSSIVLDEEYAERGVCDQFVAGRYGRQ